MKNELERVVEKVENVQEVEVKRILRVNQVFVKAFAIKPYLPHLRNAKPHYNSVNSNLDYRA